ncbi:hypothetical protein [Bacillus thuringiensis]|uniref:hypothetical protein n=1 Tax=Bacillus thuringiensis TaxID=1428 RepID=UPI0032C4824C
MLIFATVDASRITFSVNYFTLHGTVPNASPRGALGKCGFTTLSPFLKRFPNTKYFSILILFNPSYI